MANPREVLPFVWMVKSLKIDDSVHCDGDEENEEESEEENDEVNDEVSEEESEGESEEESEEENDEENGELIGGAICIHSDGILMTVTAIKHSEGEKGKVYVRDHNSDTFREANWIHSGKFRWFGISFLILVKKHPDENFDFFPIPEGVDLDTETEIFAFMHDEIPFSGWEGKVAYPYMDDVDISPDQRPFFTYPLPSILENRTVGSVGFHNHSVSRGLINYFDEVHPLLPLVQVLSLGSGSCGCPVFTKDNQLIGLFAASIGYFQYLIPTKILHEAHGRYMPLIQKRLGK